MGSAKILGDKELRRVLRTLRGQRDALRNEVAVLLSFKAGLRAKELAGLSWPMVLAANGSISPLLSLEATITKRGRPRRIPVHPDLATKLKRLHLEQGRPRHGPVLPSSRGGHLTAKGVVNWFLKLYADVGLQGCSSHSGRRTFITMAARALSRTGGSLRDVQELAGHRALTTTELYIQGDRDAQRRIIRIM